MRVLAHPRVALVLALAIAPVLVACGVILDVADDTATPRDRVDGDAADGGVGQEGGPLDPDATANEAGGDACAAAAACTPERLTTLSGGVLRLVVAGSSLYAGYTGPSAPRVVSLATSAPGPALDLDPQSTVPDNFRGDSNIVVDGSGAVYWGTPNGLRRREPGAGPDASTGAGVTDLSGLGAPVSGIRIADGRLHFTVNNPVGGSPNGGRIASCPLPGCNVLQDTQTDVTVRYPLDVIAIGASRYWLGFDDVLASVVFRSKTTTPSDEQKTPSRMATDGQNIFWSTFDNLRMFTIGSAAPVDLLPSSTDGTTRVNGVAVDPAGTLYVTKESSVLRCAIVGGKCSFATIATTADLATDVAADATYLYWGTNKGAVWRLRKP